MRFRWADCEVDREARTLERAGRPFPIQPLVLDLLLLLLQQRGRVVAEDVLRRKIWRDVQVTGASLRRLVKEARRAIGDDGSKQEQIQTIRGRGFRFAAPVTVDDGWDTSFVGRSDVVEALEHKLEEVAGGLGGLTLLHGPAGIGKTRTLSEIEGRAAMRGFRVLHGSGRADAAGDAFHPWLDVARELGIEAVLPGPSRDAPTRSDASRADAARYAGFREVSKTLARAARTRPILIALDDLQLADRDGLEALRFLAPALVRASVWILGAYRTSSSSRTEEALRTLAAIGADTSTQDLTLRGLDVAEMRSLLRNHLRAEIGVSLAALLSDRAGGNPIFSLEIGRSLQRDGQSLEADPGPEIEARLAQGIMPLLERRLSTLPAESQRLLRIAAAIGTDFDAELLQAADGCSEDTLADALGDGELAGLVEPRLTGNWRFAHPLFAEALYGQLQACADDAAAQHLRIADAIERRAGSDPISVARHLLLARPLVTAERVLPHARAAASEAWRKAAFADGEYWYRHAVALAEQSNASPADLCDLLLGLGDMLVAGVGVASARIVFQRAARLALRGDDLRGLALAALGYAHRPSGLGAADDTALEWLRAAHARPCGDVSVDAMVSSRLGAELNAAGPEHASEAEERLGKGVDAARVLGDPFTLGRVLADRNDSAYSAREPHEWVLRAEEYVRWAREAGDEETEFRGLQSCATGMLEIGDRDRLEAAVAACRDFARDHPFRYARTVTGGMVAMLALLDGRLADARAAIDEAERDSGGAISVGLASQIAVQRFWLAYEEGCIREMAPALERAWVRFPALPALQAGAGLAHAFSGDHDAARRSLQAVIDHLPRLPYDRGRLPTLVLAAEVAYHVGARDAATAVEAELLPHAHLGAVVATASAYAGCVAQGLGWTAATRGEVRTAVEHFQRALVVHDALRASRWCARSAAAIDLVRQLRLVRGSTGA